MLQWSAAASLPNPRNFLAVAASATRLYAVGGLQDGTPGFTPYVDEYNPDNNSWTRLPNMPIGRIAHGAAVVENFLYVLSGFTDPGFNAQDPSCYRINLTTKAGWERIADLPVGRRDFGVAVAGHNIYVIGGNIDEQRSTMRDVHHFWTDGGAWFTDNPLNVGRRYPACANPGWGPWIAAIGGIDNGATNVVEAFDGTNWVRRALTPPRTFRNGQIAYIAPYWYLLCGVQNGSVTNGVMRLDAMVNRPEGQWITDAVSPPNKRSDFGAAVLGGKIYLVGGMNDVNQRVGVVDVATAVPVGALYRPSVLHQSMNFSEDE